MKYIGHPLFNDLEYGGDKVLKGTTFTKYKQFVINNFELLEGQALHAKTLGFEHPKTKEYMRFDSELPDGFSIVLERWNNYLSTR
jgi:23S rRNA pseudouridine1911/1915/1917 synthase